MYIGYWAGKRKAGPTLLQQLDAWKTKVLDEVQQSLSKGQHHLYPRGNNLQKEAERLGKDLMFLKEDRAPHVVVIMCKTLYVQELEAEMQNQDTFRDAGESEEEILQRHREYHIRLGLETNERLCYPYGIWKSAKRKMRWISGVKKSQSDKQKGLREKPKGSIAGVGTELVGVLNQIMDTLKQKDTDGMDRGEPKKVWFVRSVEEVVQPIRFQAEALGRWRNTVDTVDFVTMYPKFDQKLLRERLEEAVREAWEFEESKQGEPQRLAKNGWLQEAGLEGQEGWTQQEVNEMVAFVINNGYLKCGSRIKQQVRGFGMGLQCAPQLANLACYIPERDFASTCQPEEVLHNYRFIDDILTLSGKIPSPAMYEMEYKSTRKKPGEVEYLGMKVIWHQGKADNSWVTTELLQREAAYPIRILRYPTQDSLASDEQRMGVVMGQFIRAQRICSHISGFKEAVLYVVKCAYRRGYPRRHLHAVWGRFLGQWWAARELRRGQLRTWFRRMTRYAKGAVRREAEEMIKSPVGPTNHPEEQPWWDEGWSRRERPAMENVTSQAPHTQQEQQGPELQEGPAEAEARSVPSEERAREAGKETRGNEERVPAELLVRMPHLGEGGSESVKLPKRWWAKVPRPKDGHCMYHCLLGKADLDEVRVLRVKIASWLEANLERLAADGQQTMAEWILATGDDMECRKIGRQDAVQAYLEGVQSSAYGGTLEVYVYTQITGQPVEVYVERRNWYERIFQAPGEPNQETVKRMVYVNGNHYDELQARQRQEDSQAEGAAQEAEGEQNMHPPRKEKTKETTSKAGKRMRSPEEQENPEPPPKRARKVSRDGEGPAHRPRRNQRKRRGMATRRRPKERGPNRGPRRPSKPTEGPEEAPISVLQQKEHKERMRILMGMKCGHFWLRQLARRNPEKARAEAQKEELCNQENNAHVTLLDEWRERLVRLELEKENAAKLVQQDEQRRLRLGAIRAVEDLEEGKREQMMDEWRKLYEGWKSAVRTTPKRMTQGERRTQETLRGTAMGRLTRAEEDNREQIMDLWRKELSVLRRKEGMEKADASEQEKVAEKQREEQRLAKIEGALSKSYYEALGICRDATATEVRRAGRRMNLECHPDKFQHCKVKATSLFQAVRKAVEVLQEPKSRAEYDSTVDKEERAGEQQRDEPQRPEFGGAFGNFQVLSLSRRYGVEQRELEEEDERIVEARGKSETHGWPSRPGPCWILLPGLRIQRARFLGNQLSVQQGTAWYASVVHLEGSSVAVALRPGTRLFNSQADAMVIQSMARRRWRWTPY
jgi:hypothetical protein